MIESKSWMDRRATMPIMVAACVCAPIAIAFFAPVLRVATDSGHELLIWRSAPWALLRWPLTVLALALAVATLAVARHRQRDAMPWAGPLAWIPVAGLAFLFADHLPPGAVSAVVPLTCGLLGLSLVHALRPWLASEPTSGRDRIAPVLFLLSLLLYTGVGLGLAITTGEHVGDEAHYLKQAGSLYEDHDLDIRNDVMEKGDRKPSGRDPRLKLHVSRRSRGDHWYSFHPFGLPFVLAPFWGLGLPARYLVLGLIGALANLGMYRLCLAAGALPHPSALVVATIGMTYPWVVYAGRALPEMLGAALLTWLFWAVVAQPRRPWLSAFVGAGCAGYLVMTHERFIPLSALGLGFYGLVGLFGGTGETWTRRLIRLSVFTLVCFAGYGAYIAAQFAMFKDGLKFSPEGIFMDYPMGMWGVIAGARGIAPVMPGFLALVGALACCLFLGRRSRWYALAVLASSAACIVLSCSNHFYTGGSCVPGRYIFVIIPLLAPAAALMIERTSTPGRWLLIAPAIFSFLLLPLVFAFLPVIGRSFVLPIDSIRVSHPLLAALFHPHAQFVYESTAYARLATTVYTAGAMLLAALVLAIPAGRRTTWGWAGVAGIVALGVAAQAAQPTEGRRAPYSLRWLTRTLTRIDLASTTLQLVGGDPDTFTSYLTVRFPELRQGKRERAVTTEDLGKLEHKLVISQPRVAPNDWDGRGYAWSTLTAPFSPLACPHSLHIEGRLEGNATAHLAVREGRYTILEQTLVPDANGQVRDDLRLDVKGRRGHLYILLRLSDGEGKFVVTGMTMYPLIAQRALPVAPR